MRVVLDTNVIIAAFATRGLCCDVFEICLQNHEMLIGAALLKEIRKNLARKVKLHPDVIEGIVDLIQTSSETVIPASVDKGACRDSSDLHLLGTAEAGRADYLITGDPDLLILKKYSRIKILSPRDFWESAAAAQ